MDSGDYPMLSISSSSSSLLPPPPPPPVVAMAEKKPRRRAREVSSRYLLTPSPSPLTSSSSSVESPYASPRSDYPPPSSSSSSVFTFPKKHLHQPRRTPSSSPDTAAALSDSELDRPYPDENHPLGSSTVRRSLETPLSMSALRGKSIPGSQTAKKRAVVRLFTDHASSATDHNPHLPPPLPLPPPPASSDQHPNSSKMTTDFKKRPKPPSAPMALATDHRTMAATPRSTSASQTLLRPAKVSGTAARRANLRPLTPARPNLFVSDADNGDNELLGEAFSFYCSSSNAEFSDFKGISGQGGLCDSPPLPCASSRARMRASIDVRSSMPAADQLPTMSTRRVIEGGGTCRKDGADDLSLSVCRSSTNSMCLRSLNSQQQQQLNLSRPPPPIGAVVSSLKPPVATTKLGFESKKLGKKASVQQEDIHMLRLLDNCYVQWRFINAKACAAVQSRTLAAQRSLYGLQTKSLELQTSCMEKKIEFEQLTRQERLLSIVNNQIAYLDEWTTLEEDYSPCLSGTTKALQNASIRLPIAGSVKADHKEIKEAVNSATLILDSLTACVGSFLTNIVGIENRASDLANLLNKERALAEECGQLLSVAQNLQVTECSLRSQLLQLKADQQVN